MNHSIKGTTTTRQDKNDAATIAAREITNAERAARTKKTERLRAERLARADLLSPIASEKPVAATKRKIVKVSKASSSNDVP